MKKNILIVLLSLISLGLHAQTEKTYPQIERTTDWVLYQEASGVQQFYRFQECNLPEEGYYRENVLLKLVNTTNETKQVEWDLVMWYGKNCVNCNADRPEEHRSFIIPPYGVLEATCSLYTPNTLKIFSKFLNYKFDDWVLTHFELRNFTVK